MNTNRDDRSWNSDQGLAARMPGSAASDGPKDQRADDLGDDG